MTWRKREIMDITRECNLVGMRPHLDGIYFEALAAFAKLVREDEREAAQERVVDLFTDMKTPYLPDIIKSIRARGQA